VRYSGMIGGHILAMASPYLALLARPVEELLQRPAAGSRHDYDASGQLGARRRLRTGRLTLRFYRVGQAPLAQSAERLHGKNPARNGVLTCDIADENPALCDALDALTKSCK
jgi:hypothetical protein